MNVLARIGIALLLGLTLPLYYILVAGDGFLPWFAILIVAILPEFQIGYFGLVTNCAQLLIYAALLWWLASKLLQMLRTIDSRRWRAAAAICLVGLLVVVGSLPLYTFGHSRTVPKPAIDLYSNMLRNHRV